MARKSARAVNREFHSTFATIAVTVLSIMLAFYGIMVINLAQQALVIKESVQASNEKAQASEENAVSYLRQTDDAIRNFVYTTEPRLASANWSIPMDQENNLRMLLDPYKSEYMPSYEVVDADVSSILGNFSEGLQMDESVRDWLSQNNVTYFVADYVPAIINLDDLIHVFYEQFPSPPAKQNASLAIIFIDDNFSNTQPFLNWLEKYQSFHQGVSNARSRINIAISGISQAYLDSATMDSQTIRQLQQENTNNSWAIQSFSEIMTYNKAMSTYYPSVFESLDTILSSASSAEDCINQYNVYFGEYEGYVSQYDAIHGLALSNYLLLSVGLMASSVVISMSLLGGANWFESKLDNRKPDVRKWRRIYYVTIWVCIVLFVLGAIFGLIVLGTQISKLIPPL